MLADLRRNSHRALVLRVDQGKSGAAAEPLGVPSHGQLLLSRSRSRTPERDARASSRVRLSASSPMSARMPLLQTVGSHARSPTRPSGASSVLRTAMKRPKTILAPCASHHVNLLDRVVEGSCLPESDEAHDFPIGDGLGHGRHVLGCGRPQQQPFRLDHIERLFRPPAKGEQLCSFDGLTSHRSIIPASTHLKSDAAAFATVPGPFQTSPIGPGSASKVPHIRSICSAFPSGACRDRTGDLQLANSVE
jgi:hypothetical protein